MAAFKTDTTVITLVSIGWHLTTQHRNKTKRSNSSEIIARNIPICKARCNRNLLIFLRITSNGHDLSTKQNLVIEKLVEICQLVKLEFALYNGRIDS